MKSMKTSPYNLALSALFVFLLNTSSAELNILSKTQWNGKVASAELTALQHPLQRIVICHTASGDCDNQETCAQRLQIIQEYQMKFSKFDDIAYNFLIGNDGNVYEGRGWDHQGAYARGFNAGSLGIAFIGTYESAAPTNAALQAAQDLIESGVQLGKIADDYKLFGHKQLAATSSPGTALYAIIKEWAHWSNSN